MSDFFTLSLLTKTIAIFIASVAFSVIFKIGKRHIIYGGILATVTFLIYYTALFFGAPLFTAAFVSTAAAALCSEILARIRRAPTLVFLLASVIPTVPGGNLYYAMRDLLSGDTEGAIQNFLTTMKIGLGIAGGIVTVSILFAILSDAINKVREKK